MLIDFWNTVQVPSLYLKALLEQCSTYGEEKDIKYDQGKGAILTDGV